jgi:outer membrane receptor protein involved in Fe transport
MKRVLNVTGPSLVPCGAMFGVVLRAAVAIVAVASLLLVPGSALAQTAATGTIEGVVKDGTGGALPGVTVVVKNIETNQTRDLVTDDTGRYRAAALPPGLYQVVANLSGFQPSTLDKIQVVVGQSVPLDVTLRPAGVSETLTVSAESPIVDTVRTDVSNVVGETAISNLPINGRRWENFVLLGPGVTNDGNFGLVSYRGISGLYNNNTVDGADNNQAFFSEARGRTRTSYSISQAAIKEFQVGISNFSAEFGRAAGGTVNAVTKSGTNRSRGELFYFLRDDSFTAKDPFFPAGVERPDERRHQFGAAVGGAIVPNKVFYFVNYDQQLRDFPYFVRPSGNAFFTGACTAVGCPATLSYFQSLSNFFPREGNNRILLGKVDFALNNAHRLTVQYNLHRWDSPSGVQTQPTFSVSEDANGKDIVKTDFMLVTLNSVLSQRLVNELRFQTGRDFEAQEPNGIPPSTTVTNGINYGMPDFLPRPKYPNEWRYQFIDSLNYFVGAHNLKAGIDINYVREDIVNLFQGGGVYAYGSLQNIAQDCPAKATGCLPTLTGATSDLRHYNTFVQAFDLRGSGFRGDVFFTTSDYNFFVQDAWTLSPRITANFGVRYEYQQLPQPGKAAVNGVVFNGNPNYAQTQSFNKDKNNWGPRVGVSYDVTGNHSTVIRAGWGIYYGRTSNSAISSALTNNAVTFATYNFTPTSAGAPQYPNTFAAPPAGSGTPPAIQYLAPGLERPTINMGELTVEHLLGTVTTVSASYLYSAGSHLPTFVDENLPQPTATVELIVDGASRGTIPFFRGARPDTRITNAIKVDDSVESTYHALVLQVNRRFSKGLLLNANYTLSKSEDTGQNSTTFISNFSTLVNPFDVEGERGPASFDRKHRFVASVHYAPSYLWGIQVGGTGTFESGLPLNPSISINAGAMSGTGATSTATVNGSGASNRAPFDTRNGYRQTGRKTIDLRISKTFNMGGQRQIVALWEAFNVANWVNYTGFTTTAYRATSSSVDAAGKVTVNIASDPNFKVATAASNTLFGPRDMQLGVKFLW